MHDEGSISEGARPDNARIAGVDGGGTHMRIALADCQGRELLRREALGDPADAANPAASADALIRLIRSAISEAGASLPLSSLCAGMAGAGTAATRLAIRDAVLAEGVAARVSIMDDSEIALEGALAGRPGILLIAGTGSIAYGRAEDGRVERSGGWGMRVGDEGSGYDIGRAGVRSALRAADGRGPATVLLPRLLETLGFANPAELAAWANQRQKRDVAALAPHVVRSAVLGDAVAASILDTAADELVRHVQSLVTRLAPWSGRADIVLQGGLFREQSMAERVQDRLLALSLNLRKPEADAVAGAVQRACSLLR